MKTTIADLKAINSEIQNSHTKGEGIRKLLSINPRNLSSSIVEYYFYLHGRYIVSKD
jgi:hypothetical protein